MCYPTANHSLFTAVASEQGSLVQPFRLAGRFPECAGGRYAGNTKTDSSQASYRGANDAINLFIVLAAGAAAAAAVARRGRDAADAPPLRRFCRARLYWP